MKIIRFLSGGIVRLGKPNGDGTATPCLPGSAGIREAAADGFLPDWSRPVFADEKLPVEKILAPLIPADILCIGLNYREHAAEGSAAFPAQWDPKLGIHVT